MPLALFVAWLMGKVAELRKLHHSYQANTEPSRHLLFFVFRGLRVLRRAPCLRRSARATGRPLLMASWIDAAPPDPDTLPERH